MAPYKTAICATAPREAGGTLACRIGLDVLDGKMVHKYSADIKADEDGCAGAGTLSNYLQLQIQHPA